jgi:hypothetical protein
MQEIVMPPASAGRESRTLRQSTVVAFKNPETFLPTVARIDIEDDNPARGAGANADVGLRIVVPPLINLLAVERGVFETMAGFRMFAGMFARCAAACAAPFGVNRIEWENKPPALCTP